MSHAAFTGNRSRFVRDNCHNATERWDLDPAVRAGVTTERGLWHHAANSSKRYRGRRRLSSTVGPFRRELADTSSTDFTFSETDQVGVYTVTADCDAPIPGAAPEASAGTEAVATPSAVLFSYESDTFEVFEPGVSATRVFTNDPAAPVVGVIAGQPTVTG